ncbi:MAG: hypothetical protein BMS9Abin28_2638 [Anaerolineae bacterium]|nr:MAG: hypothetical protein BMS9Abin28_2638 [Anaerolineae bacterium]
MPHNVLLICPYGLLRQGLQLLLEQEQELHVVVTAADASEAISLLARLDQEVTVLAAGWTGQDCVSTVRQLKTDRPDLRILVLSQDAWPEQVQAALAAGAIGYLGLDADLDQLIRGISTADQGELILEPAVAIALYTYLAQRASADAHPTLEDLSSREQEVLAHLVGGLSDRDIAQALFISVRTVQTHLAHIYVKLGVHSRIEAALLATRQGWTGPGASQPPDRQNQ